VSDAAARRTLLRDPRILSRVACPTELPQRFNQDGTETLAVPIEYLAVVATRA
jgi:hypothetical protein